MKAFATCPACGWKSGVFETLYGMRDGFVSAGGSLFIGWGGEGLMRGEPESYQAYYPSGPPFPADGLTAVTDNGCHEGEG